MGTSSSWRPSSAPRTSALAVAPVARISLQNQLAGRVRRILDTPGGTSCVVDVGQPLLVEVTRRAVAERGLVSGKPVWCLFKAAALRYPAA